MFTGIVEELGEIADVEQLTAAARFTVAACTWRFIASRSGSAPTAAHRRRRFSSTFSGSSSVSSPRFRDS